MNAPRQLFSASKLLTDLIEASVVRVVDGVGGTGFFVTPRTILTCAHVVSTGDAVTTEPVTVVNQQGVSLKGEVEAKPSGMGPRKLWPYPDLCVIRLTDPPEYQHQPVLVLGETQQESAVYVTGFTDLYEQSSLESNYCHIAGSKKLIGGMARKILDCEMPEGLSGAPVVDARRAVVCAVAKTRRKRDTSMGGLAIPAMAIKDAFPNEWDWNQQHADPTGRWQALRDALLDGTDPRYEVLTNREWSALTSTVTRLEYEGRQLTRLWRDVVGSLVPLEQSFIDLVALVNDLRTRPSQNGLDPLIKLFDVLASRTDGARESQLKKHASDLAVRNGQMVALEEDRDRQVNRDRPVIVVRVTPSCEKGQFNLTAWTYSHWEAKLPSQITGDLEYGPHPIGMVEDTIMRVLGRDISSSPTLLELALPDEMLDEAVEKWQLDEYDVGIGHPVVVRFGEWPGENGPDERKMNQMRRAQNRERSWSGRFGSLAMPPEDSTSWAGHWVDCANLPTASQLHGMLNGPGRAPFIAMTSWPGGDPVPMPVDVARGAGVPVILWRHKGCPARDLLICRGTLGACPGVTFRQQVISQLSSVSFDQLPEKIWKLRAGTAELGNPELGLGIAILWEDPDHIPWAEPTMAFGAPSSKEKRQ